MATSSCPNCINLYLYNCNNISHNPRLAKGHCSFLRRGNLQRSATTRTNKSSNRDLVVRNATPEVAGDVVTSLSVPGIPGFSLFGDNPWFAGAAGMLVTVPLLVQRILSLTKEVDMAAQTIEKIADTVEHVAEEVDKAAEGIKESLPDGGLKKMVSFVEELAEETAKDARKVEDLMDKVEEMDDKLEDFLTKQFKGNREA